MWCSGVICSGVMLCGVMWCGVVRYHNFSLKDLFKSLVRLLWPAQTVETLLLKVCHVLFQVCWRHAWLASSKYCW